MRRRVERATSGHEVTLTATRLPRRAPVRPHSPPPGAKSAQSVLHLQRTIGNAATIALLRGGSTPVAVSHDGAAPVVQRMKLTGAKSKQMKNKFNDWTDDEEAFEFFVEWCDSASQAEDILTNLTYSEWDQLQVAMTGKEANETTARDAYKKAKAGAGAKNEPKVVPFATVKAKIKAEGLDPAKFTDEELAIIEAGKDEAGWSSAIQSVWQLKLHTQQSQNLAADRQVKYAQAKAVGDTIFTNGLLNSVWLVAYGVATSGDASPNTTVSGLHPDATILQAVPTWRSKKTKKYGKSPGVVTDFHVPGGTSPIQDKSKRLVNPDPTRFRQADFISTWGGTEINVHVDANPQH